MHSSVARVFLLLAVCSLAVPESYANRVGGGHSIGSLSSAFVHGPVLSSATTDVTSMQRPAPAQRAPATPPSPAPDHTLPREAESPWGGMLGGALLGLGLGSLISNDPQPDTVTHSEGSSEDTSGTSASGAGESAVQAQQADEPVPQNNLGAGLLLAVFALIVFIIARRFRTPRG